MTVGASSSSMAFHRVGILRSSCSAGFQLIDMPAYNPHMSKHIQMSDEMSEYDCVFKGAATNNAAANARVENRRMWGAGFSGGMWAAA
ncbi:hypothetical protein KIN20_031446 [Parelaphostrongylus tenuis]|uniref:Uncharacterized protein n=1 Tax=Parelaphostrongylus tenuis TaxID=148309 RepID=A0AAD5WH95_PARTN|nr:hypothetical protein KIN20_031446 [Parelaphostrongylus tenuis]